MKTSKVKCRALTSSRKALVILVKGKEIYVPFRFVIDKKYHEATHELCEITIPLWLAVNRGIDNGKD